MCSKPIHLGLIVALVLCLAFPVVAFGAADSGLTVDAPSLTTQDESDANGNPYPKYNDYEGGQIACTWYVWDYVYRNLGIRLPGTWEQGGSWGDAKSWYAKADADPAYSVGSEPRSNSIAVYGATPDNQYGHVEFVTAVSGSNMTVNTGGYAGDASWPNPPGIREGWVKTGVVGQNSLIGFIYLIQENPMEVSASEISLSENKLAGKAVTCSPITVKDARGSVSFEKAGGSSALSVDPGTGKVTVKKGTTGYVSHTARVVVHAAGGNGYKPKDVSVNVSVIVVKHPKIPVINKLTGIEEGFEVRWKTATTATGYDLMYSTSGSLKNAKTVTYDNVIVNGKRTVTGLEGGKVYYLAMRSFTLSNGTKFYSRWSAPAMVKTKQSAKYNISFKANGGKGSMKAQTVKRDKATALSANKFTRSGYKFAGWNTKANGKGKAYKDRAKVKNLAAAGKTVKLYAQWKKSASSIIKTKGFSFPVPAYWRGRIKLSTTKCDDAYNVGYMTLVSGKKSSSLLAIHWAPTSEFKQYSGWGNVYFIGEKRGKKYTVRVYRLDGPWMGRSSMYTYPPIDFTKSDIAIEMLTGGKYKRIGSGSSYSASRERKSLKAANAFVKRQVFNKLRAN